LYTAQCNIKYYNCLYVKDIFFLSGTKDKSKKSVLVKNTDIVIRISIDESRQLVFKQKRWTQSLNRLNFIENRELHIETRYRSGVIVICVRDLRT